MCGIIPKWQMTEEDIKLNFITPALSPKWNGRMTMETQITDGKINLRGNLVSRAQPKRADETSARVHRRSSMMICSSIFLPIPIIMCFIAGWICRPAVICWSRIHTPTILPRPIC